MSSANGAPVLGMSCLASIGVVRLAVGRGEKILGVLRAGVPGATRAILKRYLNNEGVMSEYETMLNAPYEVTELKACPFCDADFEDGLEILVTRDRETWFVHCTDCMAEGPPAITRKGAIELWNDRVVVG